MSIIKSEYSSKWINGLVAIAAGLSGFVVTRFVDQLGVWLDLEAKITSFSVLSTGLGIVAGFLVFVTVLKNTTTSGYLKDVYNELVKVVWPSRDTTTKMTIGIAVALVVVSGIFVFVDFLFKYILSFVY